ncbi:hypothetical protein Tco_1125739 [Tanacetum coccineum]
MAATIAREWLPCQETRTEIDSHGDNENSLAPEGASEDASDSDSTSLEDFNVETGRKLETSPYDDIIVETSKLPTKLSDYVLDDKVKTSLNCLLAKNPLGANGYTKPNTNQPWRLRDLKPDWLPKDTTKGKA